MKKIFLTLVVCLVTLSSFAKNENYISDNFNVEKNINKEKVEVILNVTLDGENKEFAFSSNSENYDSKFESYIKMINDEIIKADSDDCTVSVKVRVGWGSNFVEVSVTRKVECSQWIAELRKIKAQIQEELGM